MGSIRRASYLALRFVGTRRTAALLSLGAVFLASPLIAAGASASQVHHSSTTTQAALLAQGKKFYRGQTITIIAGSAAGGGMDEFARALGPAVGIYLHASVVVDDIAASNGLTEQDAVAAAAPDGLTVGSLNDKGDILNDLTNVPSVNFNPLRVAFLGATGPNTIEFGCLTSSPYSTMQQVITAKTPVSEVVVTTGSQTVSLRLINASFGFPTNIISGYTGSKVEVAGYERGDGNCSALNIADLGLYIAAGKAKILARTTDVNKATAFYNEQTNAPYFTALEKQFPAKTEREKLARSALHALQTNGQEFFTQAKVSSDKVVALRAAFKFAFTNSTVEKELLAEGNPIGYVDGFQAKLDYEHMYTSLKHVASILNG